MRKKVAKSSGEGKGVREKKLRDEGEKLDAGVRARSRIGSFSERKIDEENRKGERERREMREEKRLLFRREAGRKK